MFLVLRLVADFATAIYLLVSASYLVSVWFFIVGVATVLSERKAVRVARQ